MNHDCITIEKYINNCDKLTIRYSECINEVTIKILRKGAPNKKWSINSTFKANITYELMKTITYKFIFVPHPNTEDIIKYVEKQLERIEEISMEEE